ncbi:MAG: VOC family protein [Candidatus Eremiobacteraeota bacterium]|nr:VOC family protein [Candidatus Eremiobacteraeota bacterium]MBV8339141.1 VOC family protein [Candidatus Eremiobacteraeota bacterium]MBV8597083.1 VOC family protein [Candidatus Eremiobacteraeota bacterium]MBV8668055.1 VOC family protein [Candidatus Eremiobacteraeota bacterium]
MYISVVRLPVADPDRAIDFYVNKLGWEKTMDVSMGEDGRWVTVAPQGEGSTAFVLEATPQHTGGSSGVILEVDDVYGEHDKLSKKNVEFTEKPRTEPWGGWAMFKDTEGNVHGLHSGATANIGSG